MKLIQQANATTSHGQIEENFTAITQEPLDRPLEVVPGRLSTPYETGDARPFGNKSPNDCYSERDIFLGDVATYLIF
jgi:hypothetical protein